MSQAIDESQAPAPEAAQPQESPDIFADNISEEDIGKMFDEPSPKAEQGDAEGTNQAEAQPEVEAEAAEEQKPEESKREEVPGDDDLILPLATGEMKLTGNEVCDYVELGMAAKQHGQRIQEAFAFQEQMKPLVQALQSDPGLVAHLQAYGQAPAQPQVQQPDPYAGNDEVSQFKQRLLQEAAEMLIPQLTKQIEEKYKPFVSNVESFAAQYNAEKAKAVIEGLRSDPDFDSIHTEMYAGVGDAVAKGKITAAEAAEAYASLQNDPAFYSKVFGAVKAKRGGAPAHTAAPGVKQIRKVVRAPKLESQGNFNASEKESSFKNLIKQAQATGDPEDVGRLFG